MTKINLKSLIDLKNKFIPTQMSKLRLFTVLSIVIKNILFMALVQTSTADSILWGDISTKFIIVYLAFTLIFYSIGYLFSKNKQIFFCIIFNILCSVLLVADLWYFRANNYLLGVKNVLYKGTFNPLEGSLCNFRAIDIVFVIDIAIMILWILIKKIRNNELRDIGKFSLTIRYSLITLLLSYIALDICSLGGWDGKIIKVGWDVKMTTKSPGPIGYHLVEAVRSSSRKIKNSIFSSENLDIENWIKHNQENLTPNEYMGTTKGKNVIFLQIESLENFVINESVNGKEITPFLNKLTNEGLYFDNFYEQNNAGNSIDCDFMVNSSVLPLGSKITGLNYGENVYLNSLPRILNKQGYTTISTHAEEAGEFNWTELHKNSFGIDKTWNIDEYDYEETVGYGLSDRSFLSQIADKISEENEPFFIQAPTLSSHGPFNIDSKYRELGLPEEIDESYLGGYLESVHYTDKQIEMFFNELEQYGLLENTMIVIYGDHTGVHKYYNEDIQKLSYDGDWWKVVDHKIPLIIYSDGIKPKLVEAHGGQIDLLPTVLYLLGIDDSNYKNTSMGRVLVNTNRDATVIKGNTIVGNVKSDEEKEHLLKAYDIGEKIIKNDYFSK